MVFITESSVSCKLTANLAVHETPIMIDCKYAGKVAEN